MTVSRGEFLKLCGGTLMAAQLDPISLIAGPETRPAAAVPVVPTALQPCSACAAQFRQHVESTFVVGGDHQIRVRLAKVIERSHDSRLEQFSLVFHTEASLDEGTHRFHHPALGQFDLYIAPIGAASNRPAMVEACFSRPANKPGPRTDTHT